MKKRILQINSVAGLASTGKIVESIGVEAIKNGYESYIAYGRKAVHSQSNLIKIGGKVSILLHFILTRFWGRHGLGSTIATKRLIRKLALIQPDIIHFHNIHGYYLNYKILFKYVSNLNIPIVWTMHDCWAITGHCAHFSFVHCSKWKSKCFACPQRKNYPSSLWFDRSETNYSLKQNLFASVKDMTVITVSDWLSSIVRESFLKDYTIQTIYNGVDVDVFYPKSNLNEIKKKYKVLNEIMLIGVATAWSNRKGLDDYYHLREVLPSNYDIVLVGLTKRQIKVLPQGIIGIEKTWSQDEMASLYSASDIVLNLSQEETFGLTTVEGFACGTPSIVYNTTASPELMDNNTGKIVEPNNIKQLISAINEILLNGKDFYSANCRKRALSFFDKKEKWKQYIELYDNLLKNKL